MGHGKPPNWESVALWAGTQLRRFRIETVREFIWWMTGFSIACFVPPLPQYTPKLLKP